MSDSRRDLLCYGKLQTLINEFCHLTSTMSLSFNEYVDLALVHADLIDECMWHQKDVVITADGIAKFRKIFAAHFERMLHDKRNLPYDMTSFANQLCMFIANELAQHLNVSRIGLLLASLDKMVSPITLTDLSKEDLAMTDVILSDNAKSYIEVRACLLSAQEDGVLKHTQLLTDDGKPVLLSDQEMERVRRHSTEAEEFYRAIQDKFHFYHSGASLGACLQQLIEGLRAGGSHRGGKEMAAGEYANLAILEFADIYESLTKDQRSALDSMKDEKGNTFRKCWEILALDQHQKIEKINKAHEDKLLTDEQYKIEMEGVHVAVQTCVEITSSTIERIMTANKPQLFSMMIKGDAVNKQSGLLARIEENVANARHWFIWKCDQLAKQEAKLYAVNPAQMKNGESLPEMYKSPCLNPNIDVFAYALYKDNVKAWFANASLRQFELAIDLLYKAPKFNKIIISLIPFFTEKQRDHFFQNVGRVIGEELPVKIASGEFHDVILIGLGEVMSTGNNTYGQRGTLDKLADKAGSLTYVSRPHGIRFSNVFASEYHSLMLTTEGQVFAFGNNSAGQLGLGYSKSTVEPRCVEGFPEGTKISQIATATTQTLFLTTDGRLFGCGSGLPHALKPEVFIIRTPVEIPDLPKDEKIKQIAVGKQHGVVLTESGNVYGQGDNSVGQLGLCHVEDVDKFCNLARECKSGDQFCANHLHMRNIKLIAAAGDRTVLVAKDNQVYLLGKSFADQHDLPALNATRREPLKIKFPDKVEIVNVTMSSNAAFFITSKGCVYMMCSPSYRSELFELDGARSKFRNDEPRLVTIIPEGRKVRQVSAAKSHVMFLMENGEIYVCVVQHLSEQKRGEVVYRSSTGVNKFTKMHHWDDVFELLKLRREYFVNKNKLPVELLAARGLFAGNQAVNSNNTTEQLQYEPCGLGSGW